MELTRLSNWSVFQHRDKEGGFFVSYLGEARSLSVWNDFDSPAFDRFYLEDSPLAGSLPEGTGKALRLDEVELMLRDQELSELNVYLDISSMPKKIMAEFFVLCLKANFSVLRIKVIYALAKFSSPTEKTYANRSIEPVHEFFSGWSTPEPKPISLILGLGYEPHKAEGAAEFFEPSEQWLFKPTSSIGEYLEKVENNNRNLLREEVGRKLITYSVNDPEMTFGQLGMAVNYLLKKTNPVLLPFGPKIFFFMCLIYGYLYKELGVWDIYGEVGDQKGEVLSSGEVVGVEVIFQTTPGPDGA